MFIHITSGFLSVCAMRKTMEVPQGRRDFKKKKTTSNKDLTETIKKKTNLKFLFAVPRSFIASSSFSICLQPILYFCFVFACFSFIVVHSFYFYFFFFLFLYISVKPIHEFRLLSTPFTICLLDGFARFLSCCFFYAFKWIFLIFRSKRQRLQVLAK